MRERRERFRKGLNSLYLPQYDRLCTLLPDDWQPFSGIRSFMAQDRLYAQGRTMPGDIVTKAKGGDSPHNHGSATDWTRWTDDEEAIWIEADDDRWRDDPEWSIYLDVVADVGLRSGQEFHDPMHNELMIAVPWSTIGTIWRDKGPAHANMSIQAAMISLKEDDDAVL